MVYLLKNVIFHGYVSHNQMVSLLDGIQNHLPLIPVSASTSLIELAAGPKSPGAEQNRKALG